MYFLSELEILSRHLGKQTCESNANLLLLQPSLSRTVVTHLAPFL